MPYSTSQNPGMTQAANSLAKIFVGDPAADAAYRSQQIKNETEFLRQKQLSEQTLSEAVRRKQMEAAAIASQASANNSNAAAGANTALASSRDRENKAYEDLGAYFTSLGQPMAPAPGAQGPIAPPRGINLNDPAQAATIAGMAVRGGIDPKKLGVLALMPGQDSDALGRIFTAGGRTIGKDDYVSVGDRDANRNYELGAGERLVGGDGNVRVGVDPSYADKQARGPGAGKVPALRQQDMNSMIRSALMARGAQISPDQQVAQYFTPQPNLYADMARLVGEAWRSGGGNAASVQDLLAQYLGESDFSNFGTVEGNWNPFVENRTVTINPAVDVNTLLRSLQQGGQTAPLPSRQNVGNGGGWKVIGVQPGG